MIALKRSSGEEPRSRQPVRWESVPLGLSHARGNGVKGMKEMTGGNLADFVKKHLERGGLQAAVFTAGLVPGLYGELAERARNGEIASLLLEEGTLKGLASGSFEVPSWAKSVILVSMAQPIGRLCFEHAKGATWGIVPPQYRENQDDSVSEYLVKALGPAGFRAEKGKIPLKLAAARSGLGEYGRNNLVYTAENGSFHRLAAFYSDLPCGNSAWKEPAMMEACRSCEACLERCPTGCIAKGRFLVKAERCLTFHNESLQPLPAWIDRAWLNSLVGCMRCQSVCPVDRPFLSRIETLGTFSREETEALLQAPSPAEMPLPIAERLESIGLGEYLHILGRNLQLLINR